VRGCPRGELLRSDDLLNANAANNWAVREGGMAAYRASGGAGASPDDLDGHRDLPFKTALSHVLCGRGAPPYSQRPRC
jgi:hypothetical protein